MHVVVFTTSVVTEPLALAVSAVDRALGVADAVLSIAHDAVELLAMFEESCFIRPAGERLASNQIGFGS